MAALDQLLNARASLDALVQLLGDAAEDGKAVSDIADQALVLLNDARSAIDVMGEDEGTE